MDFDSHFLSENTDDVHPRKDHSPNAFTSYDDILSSGSGKISSPADDFEHITGSKIDTADFDLLDTGLTKSSHQTADLLDDFKANNDFMSSAPAKSDNYDVFAGLDKAKESTMDFMAAERNHVPHMRMDAPPPAPPAAVASSAAASVPSAPMKTSIYDDIENDYLKPYTSAKNNEKFISSEDLLGDFKDVQDDVRTKTPDLFVETSSAAKKSEPLVETHEPIPVEKPAPVPAKPVQTKPVQDVPNPIVAESVSKKKPEMSHSVVEDIAEVIKPTKPTKTKEQMISAEEMFYKIGLVESLIYWRDPKKSGIVFGAGLLILLAVSSFSVISVFAYASLLALFGTISFRIYKNVLQAVQKTSEGHPFKDYLEYELALPQEKVSQVANVGVAHINAFLAELRRLFLVEDLVDSIKFGLFLWCLTYLGSWFNGMTLVILGFVALFTLPKVYENNKQSIDTYLDLVRSKILEITDKVKAAVPIGKKPESDKKEN